MVHFADVLSQVSTDTGSEDTLHSVRVNTAGWDSWLKAELDVKAPAASSFYLDLENIVDEPDVEEELEAAATPFREDILHSPYAGPVAEPLADDRPRETAPPIDLSNELAHERLQLLSEPDLRALRRRLARRVHPDVPTADCPDAAAMVRVNVAIDDALRERRLRVPRR
jgi:hypothetical protein